VSDFFSDFLGSMLSESSMVIYEGDQNSDFGTGGMVWPEEVVICAPIIFLTVSSCATCL